MRPRLAALPCASGLGGGLVPSGNSTFDRPLVSRGDGAAPSDSKLNLYDIIQYGILCFLMLHMLLQSAPFCVKVLLTCMGNAFSNVGIQICRVLMAGHIHAVLIKENQALRVLHTWRQTGGVGRVQREGVPCWCSHHTPAAHAAHPWRLCDGHAAAAPLCKIPSSTSQWP